MGKAIVKIKDKYFEWSTNVDAPVTLGMSKSQLETYVKQRYGLSGAAELDERLKRVEDKGHSFLGYYGTLTLDELIAANRAGDNENELTKEQIYNKYT